MKRFLVWICILVLLLLDWAALDDITTGNEPDYYGEYAVLVISAVVYGVLGYLYITTRRTRA